MANTVVKQKSPLWEPQDIDRTNVAQFINHVNKKYSLQLKTYEDLHTWSVGTDSLQSFWKEVYLWLELSPPGASEVGRVFEEGVSRSTVSSIFCRTPIDQCLEMLLGRNVPPSQVLPE